MKQALATLLAELESFGEANDRVATDRASCMLNITDDTGLFLSILVRACSSRRVLEIGTSNGYSTLWLAEAAASIGGSVVTVEISSSKIALAQSGFERSGLRPFVTQVHGDGGTFLASASEASFDLVFLDSDRSQYVSWWAHIRKVLRPGGVLVVDNATSHRNELLAFMQVVSSLPEFVTVVIPVGNGEFVATHSGTGAAV